MNWYKDTFGHHSDKHGSPDSMAYDLESLLRRVPCHQHAWIRTPGICERETSDGLPILPAAETSAQMGDGTPFVSRIRTGPALPPTVPGLPTFFGTHSSPICVIRFDPEYPPGLQSAVSNPGAVRLLVRSYEYDTSDIVQLVIRIALPEQRSWFQENISSIGDEDVARFGMDLLRLRRWRLYVGGYRGRVADFAEDFARLEMEASEELMESVEGAFRVAARRRVAIEDGRWDFKQAAERFLADNIPLPE